MKAKDNQNSGIEWAKASAVYIEIIQASALG
jgi:hypothetical protein